MKTNWVILTGEYPPQTGGVADYTQLVSRGLVASGDRVEIFAPPCDQPDEESAVVVRRLPDHFGPRGLAMVSKRLRSADPNRIVLVQYVPHAFGYKAMNVRFCAWLMSLRGERIWTMFHEVAYPFLRGQPLRHHFLASVNHAMAAAVARASRHAFVSIPAWERLLRPMAGPRLPIQWIPVPSNLPMPTSAANRNGKPVIAHFGTYSGATADLLRAALLRILEAHPDVTIRLLGRGGEAFAASLPSAHRIEATGILPAEEVSKHLAAADVILQPYVDGVTTRRSSVMAALALGRAVVTNKGPRTEALWAEAGCVALVPTGDAIALADSALSLLNDEARRDAMGVAAKALYDSRFDVRHTVRALREAAGQIR